MKRIVGSFLILAASLFYAANSFAQTGESDNLPTKSETQPETKPPEKNPKTDPRSDDFDADAFFEEGKKQLDQGSRCEPPPKPMA